MPNRRRLFGKPRFTDEYDARLMATTKTTACTERRVSPCETKPPFPFLNDGLGQQANTRAGVRQRRHIESASGALDHLPFPSSSRQGVPAVAG